MSKSQARAGKLWTGADKSALRKLAEGNTPTRVMGFKLGRSAGAVQKKAQELGVTLKPTNRSPYGSKKK